MKPPCVLAEISLFARACLLRSLSFFEACFALLYFVKDTLMTALL